MNREIFNEISVSSREMYIQTKFGYTTLSEIGLNLPVRKEVLDGSN